MCSDGSLVAAAGELAGPCSGFLKANKPSPELHLWAWDVSGAPQPDRVRALVHMRGRIRPAAPIVEKVLREQWLEDVACFDPRLVVLTVRGDSGTTTQQHVVPLDDYQSAEPDPMTGWEAGWLSHLSRDHESDLRRLAQQQVPLHADDVVRPWYTDSSCIELRIYRGGTTEDLHIPFPYSVRCGCEAIAVLQEMVSSNPTAPRRPQA